MLDDGFGADRLAGGRGMDVLIGGGDADTFVFRSADGSDTIADFAATGKGHDVIDLSHVTGIHSMADVQAHLLQSGSNTVIDFGNGDYLTLLKHAPGDLNVHDFLFN